MDDTTAEQQVLDAADRLFNERGIRTVGMDEIRDDSGVSLKRLYRLFPAKEQLVEEVLRRRDEAFLTQLADAAAQADGPREAILGFFDILHDWFAEPGFRGCPFLNAFAEMSSTSPAIGDVARRQKHRLQRHLEALAREVGGAPELAGQLLVLANGAMATSAVLGTPEPALHAKAAAAALLDPGGTRVSNQ
jgi:AcrR family transcriptional regulator